VNGYESLNDWANEKELPDESARNPVFTQGELGEIHGEVPERASDLDLKMFFGEKIDEEYYSEEDETVIVQEPETEYYSDDEENQNMDDDFFS
jgi:hypothetical protein